MRLSSRISYRLNSDFDVDRTLEKLRELFDYESIKFESNTTSIKSQRMPFPIGSFDFRIYSRKNWIGINPFVFVSGIEINVDADNDQKSKLRIEINRNRAILVYLFVIVLFLMATANLPNPSWAMIFFCGLSIISGLIIFGLFTNRFIRKEINRVIRA